jgi:hypothetical protein
MCASPSHPRSCGVLIHRAAFALRIALRIALTHFLSPPPLSLPRTLSLNDTQPPRGNSPPAGSPPPGKPSSGALKKVRSIPQMCTTKWSMTTRTFHSRTHRSYVHTPLRSLSPSCRTASLPRASPQEVNRREARQRCVCVCGTTAHEARTHRRYTAHTHILLLAVSLTRFLSPFPTPEPTG